MNNAVSGKTMENVRKHGNIELITVEKTRKYLVSEPNYYTTKFISNRNKKNSPVLDLSKTLMHEF